MATVKLNIQNICFKLSQQRFINTPFIDLNVADNGSEKKTLLNKMGLDIAELWMLNSV